MKKITLVSAVLLSMAVLTACSGEEELTGKVEKKEETVAKVDKEEKAEVVEKVKIKEGYKVYGDDTVGYVQLTDDFVNFIQPGSTTTSYSTPGQTAVVNMMDWGTNYNLVTGSQAVIDLVGTMEKELTTVGGFEALELYSYEAEHNYHFYVYLVDTGEGIRYLTLEFSGEKDKFAELQETIKSTFSIKSTGVTETSTEEEEVASEDGEVQLTYEEIAKGGNGYLEADLEIISIKGNVLKYKVYSDFREDSRYMVSVTPSENKFEYLAQSRTESKKDDKGVYLEGEITIDKPYEKGKSYYIMAVNLSDYKDMAGIMELFKVE